MNIFKNTTEKTPETVEKKIKLSIDKIEEILSFAINNRDFNAGKNYLEITEKDGELEITQPCIIKETIPPKIKIIWKDEE